MSLLELMEKEYKCENCGCKLTFKEWAEHLDKKDLRGISENGFCLSCGKNPILESL